MMPATARVAFPTVESTPREGEAAKCAVAASIPRFVVFLIQFNRRVGDELVKSSGFVVAGRVQRVGPRAGSPSRFNLARARLSAFDLCD